MPRPQATPDDDAEAARASSDSRRIIRSTCAAGRRAPCAARFRRCAAAPRTTSGRTGRRRRARAPARRRGRRARANSSSCACRRSICSSCVRRFSTGSAGSISRTAARMAGRRRCHRRPARRGQTHGEVRVAVESLERGQVDGRRRGAAQLGVLRVAGDADDLDLIRRRRPDDDPTADRVLAAEILAHERLIDDRHLRRGLVVAVP